jgi:sigma-B regulation protein RsbU (phosphoserine phosphatase)
MSTQSTISPQSTDWRTRLDYITQTMRELSSETDPNAMVAHYGERVARLVPRDRVISLSRRDLPHPQYRITRYNLWKESINPWKDKNRLPIYSGGVLANLIYGDEPTIINDLQLDANEPAAEYLQGQRSLAAIPLFDKGTSLNMVVFTRQQPNAVDPQQFPELVWMSNLFGRATHNLVLSHELDDAYQAVDRELKSVAQLQRFLLPKELPKIKTMDLAAHYETSRRAGGDYYDFFPLPDNRWGIIIADVSGHGTPAAVMMAITHAIAHAHPGPVAPAGEMLNYINRRLAERYTNQAALFVTAFYGIYDDNDRTLRYAIAGHNPPRVKKCDTGETTSLDGEHGLPLGIERNETYTEMTRTLTPGDQIIFYTDGITEAANPHGELFGLKRLDNAITWCRDDAKDTIESVLHAVKSFTHDTPADDDRTLLAAKIR